MNSPWLRNSLLGLSLLVGFGSATRAETIYATPTAYVLPTSYYPTAYVYPTAAYVYPTSYFSPTTYTATSYDLTPTSYLVPAVSLRRSLLFPRRYVARPVYTTALAYTPTAYYTPTVYSPTVYTPTVYSPTVYTTSYYSTVLDYPVVASSTVCPETTRAAYVQAPEPQRVQAPARSESGERAPSSAVESVPSNTVPSNVPPYDSPNPGPPPGNYVPRTGSGAPPAPAPGSGTESPPAVPSYTVPPEPKPPAAGAPNQETSTAPAPPAITLPPEPGATSFRREVRKPVAPTWPASRISNILEGKVVSSDTRQPEEGVRITLSSRLGSFENRVTTTDAYGHYAVRLPDGDWTVNVEMPSGRVYTVSQITISGGQIVDSYGRGIPSLTITR